jgi:hypothetical protein
LDGRVEVAMTKDDKEKAAEILKKRRLAAKGLEVRPDGKPVDPMEDIGSFDPDADLQPDDPEELEKKIAERALPAGIALRRSG